MTIEERLDDFLNLLARLVQALEDLVRLLDEISLESERQPNEEEP